MVGGRGTFATTFHVGFWYPFLSSASSFNFGYFCLSILAKLLQVISFVLLRKHFKVREHLKSAQVLCDILIFLLFFSLFFFWPYFLQKMLYVWIGPIDSNT